LARLRRRATFFATAGAGRGGTDGRKGVSFVATELKKIECEPKCGFMVRSHDEKELIAFAVDHAKQQHSMSVSVEEARKMIQSA
jgi:predicted small metal-binding protein